MRLLGDEYYRKWKADDAQRIENLTDFVHQLGQEPVSISHADVRLAFAKLKMKGRLDAHGVCPTLELLYLVCPDEFCLWLQSFLSDEQNLKQFTIAARIYSKSTPCPLVADTRAILPLGALGSVCRAILAAQLQDAVDEVWGIHAFQWQGARQGTQCLEIAASAHIALERFADDHGKGCMGQADVRRYYDSVDLLLVGRCLIARGVQSSIVRAFLIFQLLPSVVINSRLGSVAVHRRTLGTLTGSRSAGVLGQIPIFNVCELEEPFLQAHAWAACGDRSPALSWIDYLFCQVYLQLCCHWLTD